MCMQTLALYHREPNRFCATIPQTIHDSLGLDMNKFVQVCRDCRSWASLWLISFLADARGVRAAVVVLPSTGSTAMLRSGGAVQLAGVQDHIWLLPSAYSVPRHRATPVVPVDLYALAAGFFLFPLQSKVYVLVRSAAYSDISEMLERHAATGQACCVSAGRSPELGQRACFSFG